MIQFYWYDLLLVPGIIQGFFLAFFLSKSNQPNKTSNKLLMWMLLLAAFMLAGRIIWIRYPSDWPVQISLMADTPIFLFGPLLYYYVKRLLFKAEPRERIPLYHFIPAIVHFTKSIYYLFLPRNVFLTFLHETSYADYLITEGLAIVLNLLYWVLGCRLINYYLKKQKSMLSFDHSMIKFLRYFQLAILCCISLWLFSFLSMAVFQQSLPLVNYNSIWIAISAFIYLVGYYSLKQPGLFRLEQPAYSEEKTSDRIDEAMIENLSRKLHNLMMEEKVYLNNHLTLTELATRLGTTQNNISWLLNQIHGKSFYDFINHYRVKEFVEKVSNHEYLKKTILAMAMEVGFKSKSTFNKAFQSEMKDAPSSFIKKIKDY